MVAIVIVSHSAGLAAGVKALVEQVAQGRVKVFTAGGLDSETLGTNVELILQALIAADNPLGTLVLMDLGSALLSAEAALEFLPPEARLRVRVCAAPLVEGAVAAGVQASLGSDLDSVCREAMRALEPKQAHLDGSILPAALQPAEDIPAHRLTLTLRNTHGLHARPAARLVQTIAAFDAVVTVANLTNGKGPISARSLNRLALLGALHGHQLCVEASGPQAGAALAAVRLLVESNFGEQAGALAAVPTTLPPLPVGDPDWPAAAPTPQGWAPTPQGMLQAVPVAEGIVLAPSARLAPPRPVVPPGRTDHPAQDWAALEQALQAVRRQLIARRLRVAAQMGAANAAIFDAHLLILADPELLESVRARIFDQKMNAARAWDWSIREVAAAYTALADDYLQGRAQDVIDVGSQVLLALTGQVQSEIHFDQPVILLAQDLSPAQVAQLDLKMVVGLATQHGGPTSHSAILARAAGIPALSGLPEAVFDLPDGTPLALDGSTGRLWISPGESVRADLAARQAAWLAQKQRLQPASPTPALTLDGTAVAVAANVGGLAEAEAALNRGADGIGLLRTEFLFVRQQTAPDEQTQVAALGPIFARLSGRPVIVRTLDAGGDKQLPYIDLPLEANPALGVRAIRLSQQRPDLLLAQLRAVLRAALAQPPAGPGMVKIMFPMITDLDEVQFGKAVLEQAHQELTHAGLAHAWPVETGIMVETPAAALLAPILAPYVDFFSIGTNDLTQYTLAAERGSPELLRYSDALHPAVLLLIRQVVQAAQAHGKWVGVCGELAGDPAAVAILVGLGVRELSMHPGSILPVKALIRRFRLDAAESLAAQVLQADSAPFARSLAQAFVDALGPAPRSSSA